MPADRLTARQREVLAIIAADGCEWYRKENLPYLRESKSRRRVNTRVTTALVAARLITRPGGAGVRFYSSAPVEVTDAGQAALARG